jgi:serine/threonine protein kinase
MSPEVLLEKVPDGRADIFSLGVVFYEVLAGHHPFLAGGFVATSDRIRSETPAPIHTFNSEVPKELEKLVNEAMAKEPEQRYASTRELLEELRLIEVAVTPTGLWRYLRYANLPRTARAGAQILSIPTVGQGLLESSVSPLVARELNVRAAKGYGRLCSQHSVSDSSLKQRNHVAARVLRIQSYQDRLAHFA